MKIKVCGVTDIEQLVELNKIGVDYAGLIFYPQSTRYVLDKLDSKVVLQASLQLKKVGVFVNASENDIISTIDQFKLDMVQLHGDETPSFCKNISNKISILKSFRIRDRNDKNIDWMIRPFEEYADYYLFDTFSKNGYGGTGEQFNWDAVKNSQINKPFFLSGGIGPEDLLKVKEFSHPFFYGIDVNSKVEKSPGVKDLQKVKKLIAEKF